jgi:hypothetical protein
MGKTLQELQLKDEAMPTAGDDLGELPTFGTFSPPPPAGAYRFKLPTVLTGIWDTFDVPEKTPPQRVKAIFDREHPLLIIQSPGGKHNQEPFETRLTNNERKRGKGGSVVASDLDYVLRACGVSKKPKNNREYMVAVQQQGGKEFGADIRYSWRCSKDRDVRVRDAAGQFQVIEDKKGCGTAYYQEDVGKVNGEVPYEVTCEQCGATLRAFPNLDNIRS